MHRIKRRSFLAFIVVGALAAGGAAYTNSISNSGTTAGYAGVNVKGATLSDATYSFDSTGANITGVTLKFANDLTGDEVKAGFQDQSALTDCGAVSGGEVSSGNTTITCSISEPTSGATQLNVLVANN